jgi:ABC-type Zn uptake system ZnuABC Zn-binding protein ZnuA
VVAARCAADRVGSSLPTTHPFTSRPLGFTEIGTVFPGTSTLAEPSARDLALLEDAIRTADVPALFVGTTVSPALAEQIAADTGSRVVFLYTGSLGEPDGPAATYVDFMRYDVNAIVDALHTTP